MTQDVNFSFREQDAQRQRVLRESDPGREPVKSGLVRFNEGLQDVAAAPFRGIEGAAQSLYGLADALVFDSFRDWENRFLGNSRTAAGGVIEDIVQFSVGFLPAVGALGKIGRVQSAIAKGGVTGTLARGGLDLVAGAVADFAVFDAQEARLSDILVTLPGLQRNAVLNYLTSNKDDSELKGRLKNVLEGAGMGLAFDTFFEGIRRVKIAKEAIKAGKSAKQVQAAVDALGTKDLDEALNRFESPSLERRTDPDGARPGDTEAARDALPEGETLPDDVPAPPEPTAPVTETTTQRTGLLSDLGLDDDTARIIESDVYERKLTGVEAEFGVNPRDMTRAELLENRLVESGLNFKAWEVGEGMNLLRSLEGLFTEAWKMDLPSLGKQTLDEIGAKVRLEASDMMQFDDPLSFFRQLRKGIADDVDQQAAMTVRAHAWSVVARTLAGDAAKTIKLARLARESGEDAGQLYIESLTKIQLLNEIQSGVKALKAEQGRALVANRISVSEIKFDPTLLDDAIKNAGGFKELDALARKVEMLWGDGGLAGVSALSKGARQMEGLGFMRWTNGYYIQSLLSGGKTMAVNAISGVVMSTYMPLEHIVGGTLSGRRDIVVDAAMEYVGMARGMMDAMRMGAKSLKSGDQFLSPNQRILDSPITRDAVSAGGMWGPAMDWFSRLLPTRILTGTDEVFKNLIFRGVAYSQLSRDAANAGLSVVARGKFIEDGLEKLIVNGQALTKSTYLRKAKDQIVSLAEQEGLQLTKAQIQARTVAKARQLMTEDGAERISAIAKYGLDRAGEGTFTTKHSRESLTGAIQNIAEEHPGLKFIVPFIGVPVNIAKFGLRRTVGFSAIPNIRALYLKQRYPSEALNRTKSDLVKALISGDDRVKSDAIGRVGASVAFFAMGYSLVSEGKITGSGPANRDQRRILEDTGWMPYSFKTSDGGYVSYKRVDPFTTIIGTIADVYEYGRYVDTSDKKNVELLSTGLVAGLAKNFMSKSYVVGLSRLVEALSEPDKNATTAMRSLLGGFVPSVFAQSAFASGDEFLRDADSIPSSSLLQDTEDAIPLVRKMLNGMRARVPGLSNNLAPLRNVLGEPIKRQIAIGAASNPVLDMFVPVAYRESSSDLLNQEMALLNHGFTPPKKRKGGIDLQDYRSARGQTAYDRWQQLQGMVTIQQQGVSGSAQPMNLRKALSRLVHSREYQAFPIESTPGLRSPRVDAINGIIGQYRREAYRQTLREFPALGVADRQFTRQRMKRRSGENPIFQEPR